MDAQKAQKIVLVEDDLTMRTVLKTLLEMEGYQVVAVPDHHTEDEVIAFIQQANPELLLLDVHLHNINGINLLKRLRGTGDGLKSARVIMTSGMDTHDQCIQAGADGFLMKPYMPDELIRILKPVP